MNDTFAQNAIITKVQTTVMRAMTLKELAVVELRDRQIPENFVTFCAAKFEINDRGRQCAACSLQWHKYGGDASWLKPCGSCKGKHPIPLESLRK